MAQSESIATFIELARYLRSTGAEESVIRQRLLERGADEMTCEIILNQFRKVSRSKKRGMGTTLVLVGGIILVIGFALTFFLFHSNNSISYVMYGFTTLGALLLLGGVVCLFELR